MAENKKISQFTAKETKDFNGSEEFGGFDTQGGVNDNIRTTYTDMKADIVEAATAPTPNTKGIVYGGAEWSGTGLVFNTSVVKYSYYGFVGTIDPDTVTLDNGDSEDRFDIIAVDANNSTIVVIKGTPSPDPTFPAVGEEQIMLQPVLVKAGATTPDVTQEIVYRNNVEWTGSTAGTITGTVDFADTTNPYAGSTITRVHECNRDAIVVYTKPSGNIQYSDFTLFTMRVRLPVGLPAGVTFTLRNMQNGNNSGTAINLANHGLNPAAVNSWQLITIPTSLFNSPWGNGISFRMVIGSVNTEMSWDMDNILFSEGEAPPPPPGPDLEGYVRQDGSTPFTAPQKGVAGSDPDDLATVAQLPSPPDLTPYVKKDGSTPFTAPQEGVEGTDPNHLATVSQVTAASGGKVDSVTGDSVDNSDPANPIVNAIPLSGTEVGSPVTGDIELASGVTIQEAPTDLSNVIDDGFKWSGFRKKVGNIEGFLGMLSEDGETGDVKISHFNTTTGAYYIFDLFSWAFFHPDEGFSTISFNTNGKGIGITGGSALFSGITLNAYFGANYDDLSYVQKKYVDDNFVKKDGSTPFTAEQEGVPATSDDGLVTLAQLRSSLSTIIWGELNGDFNPSDNEGFQFSFGSALKGASGFGVPIPFHATVNAMYIQSLTNVTLETNIALYINSTETGFKFTIANGTNTGSTSGPPTPPLVLTAGDVINFKILSGSGGGGAIISLELLKIA